MKPKKSELATKGGQPAKIMPPTLTAALHRCPLAASVVRGSGAQRAETLRSPTSTAPGVSPCLLFRLQIVSKKRPACLQLSFSNNTCSGWSIASGTINQLRRPAGNGGSAGGGLKNRATCRKTARLPEAEKKTVPFPCCAVPVLWLKLARMLSGCCTHIDLIGNLTARNMIGLYYSGTMLFRHEPCTLFGLAFGARDVENADLTVPLWAATMTGNRRDVPRCCAVLPRRAREKTSGNARGG